jgi:hypothetical protein
MYPTETYSLQFVVFSYLKIPEIKIKESVLYPNPVDSHINILSSDTSDVITYIQLFDILGKLIYEENVNKSSLQINMSSYNEGVYFVRIISNKSEFKHKIIKR